MESNDENGGVGKVFADLAELWWLFYPPHLHGSHVGVVCFHVNPAKSASLDPWPG